MLGPQLYRNLLVWLACVNLAGELAAMINANTKAEQQYLLTPHWTIENGLPSNTLLNLIQTRDGYIWVGTKAGLARFDGVRFKVFTEELLFREGGELRCLDVAEDIQGRV